MNFTNTPMNFTSSLISLPEHCDKCGDNYEILRDSLTGEVFGECPKCKNMASKKQDASTILSELAEIKKYIEAILMKINKKEKQLRVEHGETVEFCNTCHYHYITPYHKNCPRCGQKKPTLTCVCGNKAKQDCLCCHKPVCRPCIDGYNTEGVVCKECARCSAGY